MNVVRKSVILNRARRACGAAAIVAIFLAPTRAELVWKESVIERRANASDTFTVAPFHFTNRSSSPVTITSVVSSCGCTTMKLDRMQYAPGEQGVVTAVFEHGSRKNLQEKTITVTTDTPDSATYSLTLKVNIPELLKLRPGFIFWRPGEARDSKTVRVEVLHDSPVRITKAWSPEDLFDVKVVTVRKGFTYDVIVTPKNSTSMGSSTITLATDTPKRSPLEFQIQASLR